MHPNDNSVINAIFQELDLKKFQNLPLIEFPKMLFFVDIQLPKYNLFVEDLLNILIK